MYRLVVFKEIKNIRLQVIHLQTISGKLDSQPVSIVQH